MSVCFFFVICVYNYSCLNAPLYIKYLILNFNIHENFFFLCYEKYYTSSFMKTA